MRGALLLPAQTHSVAAFFAEPLVAAALGALLGASLVLLTRFSVTFMNPETPEIGVARAVALSGLGMLAAFAALLLYFLFARAGLVPFGLGLVGGFFVAAIVLMFRSFRVARPSSGGGR